MANVGLTTFLHSELSDEAVPKYKEEAKKLMGAISVKVDIELNDAKLYADDVLQESDNSFVSGKITLEGDKDEPEIFAPILGKTIGEDGEVISKTTDEPIFVGFAYITRQSGKGSGVKKYRAKFYPKVQFKDFETEAKTQEDKMEYVKPSVEGTIYPLPDGTWKKENNFSTLAEAVAYLKSCFATTP